MENQAYKWLNEWVESGGGWSLDSNAGVWSLYLNAARSYSIGCVGFRDDMRQLLADAEAGRKLREGLSSKEFFYKWIRNTDDKNGEQNDNS